MAGVSSNMPLSAQIARRALIQCGLLTPQQQMPPQSRPYHNGFLPNGGPSSGPVPGAAPLLPNQGRVIQQGSARILCIADVRGKPSTHLDSPIDAFA